MLSHYFNFFPPLPLSWDSNYTYSWCSSICLMFTDAVHLITISFKMCFAFLFVFNTREHMHTHLRERKRKKQKREKKEKEKVPPTGSVTQQSYSSLSHQDPRHRSMTGTLLQGWLKPCSALWVMAFSPQHLSTALQRWHLFICFFQPFLFHFR